MPGFTFVQPDDGNPDDRTLAAVALPAPVPPGGEIALRVAWKARVPRTFARTGAIGNYYFIAQWFPKVAVFEDGRWTAHQFHANTEFFSDYGRYDVRMTVPRGWVVGATGTEQVTHRQCRRHDDASLRAGRRARFRVDDEPGLRRASRHVSPRRAAGGGDAPAAATRASRPGGSALRRDRGRARYYGEWYGAYPYGHITVIDPGVSERRRRHGIPDALHRRHAPAEPAAVELARRRHRPRSRAPVLVRAWSATTSSSTPGWTKGSTRSPKQRVQAIAFQPNYRVERFFGGFLPWQLRDIPLRRETDGNLLNAVSRRGRKRRAGNADVSLLAGDARAGSPTARRRCG